MTEERMDDDEINGIHNVSGLTAEDLLEEIVIALNELQDSIDRIDSKLDALTADQEHE